MNLAKIRMTYYPNGNEGVHYYIGDDVFFASKTTYKNARHLQWGEIITRNEYSSVISVTLVGTETQVSSSILPNYIKHLRNLKILSIPITFINILKKEDLPDGLEVLIFDNREGFLEITPVVKWPSILAVNIRAVIFFNAYGASELGSLLGIKQNHFPNLEYLSCRIDKKGKILEDIHQFESLKMLETEFVYDYPLFDKISSSLISLIIEGAKIKFPIQDICKLKSIERISLNGIQAEIDCKIFTHLPNLTELTILNSKKIINIEALLKCNNLQQLELSNCKNPFKGVEEKFYEKGFEYLNIEFA